MSNQEPVTFYDHQPSQLPSLDQLIWMARSPRAEGPTLDEIIRIVRTKSARDEHPGAVAALLAKLEQTLSPHMLRLLTGQVQNVNRPTGSLLRPTVSCNHDAIGPAKYADIVGGNGKEYGSNRTQV